MKGAASPEFWAETWAHLPPPEAYPGPLFEAHDVLSQVLPGAPSRTALEIGCVPGNWLVYLAREFGYAVSGIDLSDRIDYVAANLRFNGIEPVALHHADVFTLPFDERFDLVFSSGFVEHFDEHDEVVRRHVALAKPGGLVVIIVPNLAHLHRVLAGVFAPAILRVHRFPLMRRAGLRRSLEQAGAEVLRCEYVRTFRPVYPLPSWMSFLCRAAQKGLRMARLDRIGNPMASPYLVSVSRVP